MRYLILAALLLSTHADIRAEEAVKPAAPPTAAARLGAGLRTWFLNLKEGLSESSVSGQRQNRRLTSVAAVRGNAQGGAGAARGVAGARAQQDASAADRPAWKSGSQSKKMKQLRLEKAEFAAAVDLILAGKFKEGGEALDAFEQAHPGSSLLPELRDTREKLKEAQAAPGEQPAAPAQP